MTNEDKVAVKNHKFIQFQRRIYQLVTPWSRHDTGHITCNVDADHEKALAEKDKRIEDYKEMFEDHKRLVRELDIAVYGDGAAKQASLCDLIMPIKNKIAELEQKVAELQAEIENYKYICDKNTDFDKVSDNRLEQGIMWMNKYKALEAQCSKMRVALEWVGKILPNTNESIDHILEERSHELYHYLCVDVPTCINQALSLG